MTVGTQFATLAYVESLRRKLERMISGAGIVQHGADVDTVENFIDLADVPQTYASATGSIPTVNAAEDGLEWNPYVLASATTPTLTIRNNTDSVVDPVIQFAVGATPSVKYTMGLDDSDGDAWKVCLGTALVDTYTAASPYGDDYIIVSDTANNRIQKFLTSTGVYQAQIGSAGTGDDQFNLPRGMCTDGTWVYVADWNNHRIKKHLFSTLAYVAKIGSSGSGDDNFNYPTDICTDGTYLYVVDRNNSRVVKRNCSDLAYVAQSVFAFNLCEGCATDGTYVYVVSQNSGVGWTPLVKLNCSDLTEVIHIHDDGNIDTVALSLCVTGGFLYILGTTTDVIQKYTTGLVYVSGYGSSGSGDTQFNDPQGIITDGTYLYISDKVNNRVKVHLCSDLSYVSKFGSAGSGDGLLSGPKGVCIGGGTSSASGQMIRARGDGSYVDIFPDLALWRGAHFYEGQVTPTKYVGFIAPSSLAASVEWTLPSTDSTGTQALHSNGSGTLSWITPAPVGAKYIVQEADATLTAEQSLGALATGILKNTTTTGVGVLSIATGADLPAHILDSAAHSVSGLTTGHFLKATGATTFGFAAHGLTSSSVGAEPALGNPGTTGWVLSSTDAGVRSWIAAGGALALDDLTDVDAAAPTDHDIIQFHTGLGWVHGALPAGANHDILSATHGDTTADTVVRGDIIIGSTATPKWTRLAKGTATYVLTMGANEPAWAAPAAGGGGDFLVVQVFS